jgi:hypothetical protein
MKLNELDNSKSFASKALKENYAMPFNTKRMGMQQTQTMLRKVRGLIAESKQNSDFYQNQTGPAYMKLVFMEQALSARYTQLVNMPKARIVVENEEVEKSQVVLAAQDLVDSIQKMLEEVGQMQVKELPALVSSIESEIGTSESQSYDEQVSTQLDALSAALKEAFQGMKAALGTVTGQAPADFGGDMDTDMGDDMAEPMPGEEEMSMDMEEPLPGGGEEMDDVSIEEPEELSAPGAGRTKR